MLQLIKYILLGLTILLLHLNSFGQNTSDEPSRTIDSLKLTLKNAKHDTTRMNILFELASQILNTEPDNGIAYLLQATKYAQLSNNQLKIGEINLILGYSYMVKGEYEKTISLYTQGLNIAEKYIHSKNLTYSKRAKKLKGSLFGNFGLVYQYKGDFAKSLNYYFQGLKLAEELDLKRNQCIISNSIGTIYHDTGDDSLSVKYYQKALLLSIDLKLYQLEAIVYDNLGGASCMKGDFKNALVYFEKAIVINKNLDNNNFLAINYGNIATLLKRMGDFKNALKYYLLSEKMDKEIGNLSAVNTGYVNVADLYIKMKNYKMAEISLTKALKLSKELESLDDLRLTYLHFFELYKLTGKYDKALINFESYIICRDSIFNDENSKKNIQQELKYTYEKKAAADSVKNVEEQKVKNALLTAQKSQLKQEKTQRLALYGGLVLVIAFLGFVFNRYKITQKQKVIIEHQKVLVDKAFENLEEKNKEVMDSIHYAKRIQTALMSNEKYIDKTLKKLQKKV